jgi:RND family efflux transporter MFP subunit
VASGIVESENAETSLQTKEGAARSRLVQKLLAATSSMPQFVEDLLKTQAVVVVGSEAAAFTLERGESGMTLRAIAHLRPDNCTAEVREAAIKAFQEMVTPCVQQGKDGAVEIRLGDNAAEPQFCLITLLRKDVEVVAATAVITRCMNMERAQQRLVSMQLVAGYFDLYMLRRQSEQSQIVAQSHQHVLQLATAVATAEGFNSAAMNLCNELATRTGATRVALGWVKGQEVIVKSLSHTEEFDKRQELIKTLERVMEECIDQEEPVQFDPKGGGTQNVTRAAQGLSTSEGGNIVLTLPLRRRSDVVGAMTLEFPATHTITQQASTSLSVAVDLLAPQLYDRYQNDRWLIAKAGTSLEEAGKMMLGPQHTLAKGIAILALLALIFVCVFSPMYHVSSPFTFGATNQRKLEVPFEGQIKEVDVKPGDLVKKGQLLLKMNTYDLELRRNSAQEAYQKAAAEYRNYASQEGKEADAAIAKAEMKQAQADEDFIQQEIDEGEIRAPFDGKVLSGDLTDEVNVNKKQGDELFTIAEGSGLRGELNVEDRDIQQLKVGQSGYLATTALPTQKYKFTVSRIVPLGQAKEGSNTFTVFARLDETAPTWLPGMQGEARVEIGKRPLVWIWTHKFVDYLRMKLWF